MFQRLKAWSARLRQEVHALWLASRHPKTPWYAKLILAGIVAYALSPIDLIPDFIPLIGYFDDLILVSAGLWIALHLVPMEVLQECRETARRHAEERLPRSRKVAVVIVLIWTAVLVGLGVWVGRSFMRPE